MDGTLGFIFRELDRTGTAVVKMKKAFGKQAGFNRMTAVFMSATAACLVLSHLEQLEQRRRIQKLQREIERLRRSKGA